MEGPGHNPHAWSGARPPCARCGSSVPASADRCPNCGNVLAGDDALTVLGDLPTPAPSPAATGFADDATRFVAPSSDLSDVTRIVDTPEASSEDVTRFAAPPDEALTIAASPDSLSDAMTVAGPVTPTVPRTSARRTGRDRRDTGPLES